MHAPNGCLRWLNGRAAPLLAGDLAQLKDYVMARALWDPSMDADRLIDEFLAGYYAAAAPFVRAYMNTMVQGIEESGYYMHESFDVDAPFLRPAPLLESALAFRNASAAVAADDERFGRRVDEAGMPVMYVALPVIHRLSPPCRYIHDRHMAHTHPHTHTHDTCTHT